MTKPGGSEIYTELEWGAIRVRGQLVEVQQLSGLRNEAKNPETQSEFEKWLRTLPWRMQPQTDFDDPSWEDKLEGEGMRGPLYSLLASEVSLKSDGEEEQAGQPKCLLAYALMLRFWPGEGAFRRVGIAKVVLRDFAQAKQADFISCSFGSGLLRLLQY
jgi:hypothetical protein